MDWLFDFYQTFMGESFISGLIGAIISIVVMPLMSKKAQKRKPDLASGKMIFPQARWMRYSLRAVTGFGLSLLAVAPFKLGLLFNDTGGVGAAFFAFGAVMSFIMEGSWLEYDPVKDRLTYYLFFREKRVIDGSKIRSAQRDDQTLIIDVEGEKPLKISAWMDGDKDLERLFPEKALNTSRSPAS